MAEQHARTVQKMRRQFSDQLDYEILLIIALDTGRDGAAATTSYRGIAERANCHYNTVTGRIDRLKEAGWITVEKQGKYMAYRLQIDIDAGPNIITSGCDNYEELSQRLSQLEQTLSQRLSQLEATIVILTEQANMTKDSEEKKEENTPLNPPVGGNGGVEPVFLRPGIVDPPIASGLGKKNGHVNGFARRPPERIGVLIEAIRQVVKTTYDKDAIQDFEDAAYEVEGWGGTSESVAGFLPWWEQSEKYAGLPALKSFRAEYRNFLRGVKPAQGDANGLAAAPGKLIIAADDEAGGYYG